MRGELSAAQAGTFPRLLGPLPFQLELVPPSPAQLLSAGGGEAQECQTKGLKEEKKQTSGTIKRDSVADDELRGEGAEVQEIT